jgi:hypothetical protein
MSKHPKTHLAFSEEPLTESEDITSICGAEITNARFAFCWDEIGFEQIRTSMQVILGGIMGICSKCKRVANNGTVSANSRYCYGVIESAEEEG